VKLVLFNIFYPFLTVLVLFVCPSLFVAMVEIIISNKNIQCRKINYEDISRLDLRLGDSISISVLN